MSNDMIADPLDLIKVANTTTFSGKEIDNKYFPSP